LQFAEIAQPCGNCAPDDTLIYANKHDVTAVHHCA